MMQFDICMKCGCHISHHISDFILNDDWKDRCNHTIDGKTCTCDEFSPTLRELVYYLVERSVSN